MLLVANGDRLTLGFWGNNNGCKILANLAVTVGQWDRYLVSQKVYHVVSYF